MVFPLAAQEKADSVFTFRFLPKKDMFFAPALNNGEELARLLDCVERHREKITNGEIPLHVDGYCNSKGSEAENLVLAKTRSNRVKSELITRKGLTEDCFITRNHAEKGDFVTVRLVVPVYSKVEEPPADVQADTTVVETVEWVESAETVTETPVADSIQDVQIVSEVVEELAGTKPYAFVLRANLLRWATLTPDIGIEWRINKDWGILVNGSWTSWSWDDSNRRYALWEVSPEVRYYIGKEKRGYLGAMYHVGQFNYKFSDTGRQGDLMGGGITGGYRLKLNRSLSLDFSLGIGCTHADYDKYTVIDGVRVKRGKENRNYWGVNHAGVTLVWKLK